MFTTPCFIKKNTKQLREILKQIGYKPSQTYNIEHPYLWTCENGYYYSTTNDNLESINLGDSYGPYGICCGYNDDMFLMLASMNDENDKHQYFNANDKDFYYCNDNKFDNELANVTNNVYVNYHKSTKEEIINYYKNYVFSSK